MKRLVLLTLICFFTLACVEAWAHPPSDIQLKYTLSSRILSIIITHQVNDTKKHFINKVDVSVNRKEIITHAIKRQDNNSNQFAVYMIPDADIGDTIAVEAYCSISGKLKKEIKVAK